MPSFHVKVTLASYRKVLYIVVMIEKIKIKILAQSTIIVITNSLVIKESSKNGK